jgi:nicotinate-nucleotide pyrophosphorylase (carboxylating)
LLSGLAFITSIALVLLFGLLGIIPGAIGGLIGMSDRKGEAGELAAIVCGALIGPMPPLALVLRYRGRWKTLPYRFLLHVAFISAILGGLASQAAWANLSTPPLSTTVTTAIGGLCNGAVVGSLLLALLACLVGLVAVPICFVCALIGWPSALARGNYVRCGLRKGKVLDMFNGAETEACGRLVQLALDEDLGTGEDVTSVATIPCEQTGEAVLVARQGGVVAGIAATLLVANRIDSLLFVDVLVPDGRTVEPGTELALIKGPMRSILTMERTALNFVQRLTGVATQTRRYVNAVAGLPVKILDTRKTTPGWRLLEKYAVRCGGGHNHRIGLYDGVLIKDNHIAPFGGGAEAVTKAIRAARERVGKTVTVEVEVDTLDQLDAALVAGPDIVLLDNMSLDQMREAVRRRNAVAPSVQLEASGGVTLDTVRGIAETGVDRISVGALTHSAPALDIALDYLP